MYAVYMLNMMHAMYCAIMKFLFLQSIILIMMRFFVMMYFVCPKIRGK